MGTRRLVLAAVAALLLLTGTATPAPAALAADAVPDPAAPAARAASVPAFPPALDAPPAPAARTARPGQAPQTVAFDQYSMIIGGKRTYLWSGEMHPFRLPSPELWRDVLQKMKATGFNTVSFYFDWGYHSPAPGVYDFTGVRDMDRLLTIAEQVGLYVIARPGPYINAEADGGGFPAWLTTQAGRARSDAPDYLAATDEWQSAIDPIIARHQVTDGGGSVILYQIENELAATGASQRNYLQHLYDKARADGIQVPIYHNDKGRNGYWVPPSSTVPGTVPGPVDMYAFDGYPGGTCRTDGTPGSPNAAPDWGIQGIGGAKGGATASPATPGFVAEFGGGWFDYWGSVGTYPCTAVREGNGYERVFYGTNIANRITVQNFYMTFGGTSWGWLPAPVVYSSYDYGAAIDEARRLRPKTAALRELGYFVQSVTPLTKVDKGPDVVTSSTAVRIEHTVNPDTGTHFYFAVHNPSSATTDDAFTFPLETADGSYTVPLRLNGQDAKTLVAHYDLQGHHLVYSTSEIETHLRTGTALLYGRNGDQGETVLRYPSRPTVQVLDGTATVNYNDTTKDLTLGYAHSGLIRIRISTPGRQDLTLLIADQSTADGFWRVGDVLARGPLLVRTATTHGGILALTGDTDAPADLEVWPSTSARLLTWNGVLVPFRRTESGSLKALHRLPGAAPVTLPALTRWKFAPESPEAAPAFDDTTWRTADLTSTNSTTKPPAGQPVLTADDYGFHHGDIWYRGHFTGAAPQSVSLDFGGGGAGLLQAWLDGVYLGQSVLPTGVAAPPTRGTATFTLPPTDDGPHTLSVMVRNNAHNEDGGVNDAHKEGRGLIAVSLTAAWRLQGATGTEKLRGPLNNGGLYGERAGWYLPGFSDRTWSSRTAPDTDAPAGTSWYRTTFDLHVPTGHDASLALTIGDPSVPRSGGHYRALIFVNGWNMGQYIADVGPQHTFVLPTGVLRPNGRNTIALAVTSDGGPSNALEAIHLTNLATVRGGPTH
ncbi:beta-galactosidase [Winogradskya humida]|uniref:beta-galactosidase n=1 Tax=Winogradskya humida TaxID=113566 RepID=A0ABQ4A7D0_9ACTN|nr:beta-galactosidase [Actinoplanes humidus]GIE26764.1 beta-galactosidase [Actinoplanes humidus]